jgi:quercetin dioxygenase-like cupin family protein
MAATSLDAERTYDDERFGARTVHESERAKTVLAYFEPGQFIPVHAPDSDLTATVVDGEGVVVAGDDEHDVSPGSVVTVPAGVERGVRAETRLEATLVVSPPPTDAEHGPVREGIRRGVFRP